MSDVKRFYAPGLDCLYRSDKDAPRELIPLVLDSDYAKLEAEAQALREEVAALHARIVVVPERLPDHYYEANGYNACLDELARLNGKAVSEETWRVLVGHATGEIKHLNNGLCPDDLEGHDTRDPDCAVCQALLGEGKEVGDV